MNGTNALPDLVKRSVIPLVGILATILMSLVKAYLPFRYFQVMKMVMQMPAKANFIDWAVTPRALACAARGIDVYLPNECGVIFNYSPAWFLLPAPPGGPAWDLIFGYAIALVFFVSLGFLATPRSRGEFVVRLLATLSSAVAFAVERGNVDVLFFILLMAGALVIARSRRLGALGYAAFIVAALLKFYPAAALFVAVRERMTRFVAISAAAIAAAAWLVIAYHSDLAYAFGHLPSTTAWAMEFEGKALSTGIAKAALRLGAATSAAATLAWGVRLLLVAAMAFVAVQIWHHCRARGLRLPTAAGVTLPMVVGAAVTLFCFLVGQNFIYRGIFLLAVIPGLFAIAREADRTTRRAIVGTCILMAIGWMPPVLEAFTFVRLWTPLVENSVWLAYQIEWWWLATALTTILIAYFAESPIGQHLLGRLSPGDRLSTASPR